ncbi:unnamed protein product [Paramecium octaurelia]|uniref:Uncharacterized protein n=1 Tax=Paramecium octaurelia TaxID=43137 RepID=A0A8S1YAE3_PAROT|nr:unnamed protein product [Paramecium octaurelia]
MIMSLMWKMQMELLSFYLIMKGKTLMTQLRSFVQGILQTLPLLNSLFLEKEYILWVFAKLKQIRVGNMKGQYAQQKILEQQCRSRKRHQSFLEYLHYKIYNLLMQSFQDWPCKHYVIAQNIILILVLSSIIQEQLKTLF